MKTLTKIFALAAVVLMMATGCKKLPEFHQGSGGTPSYYEPIVTTLIITDVASDGAVCKGTVEYSGSDDLTVGFCWSTRGEPTIEDEHTIESSTAGSGTLVGKILPLSPSTTYYIRAYATNANGTYYGNILVFTTLENK